VYVRKCQLSYLHAALAKVNERFDGNLKFRNEPEPANQSGTAWRVTLSVHESGGKGGRRSVGFFNAGRKIAAACWHAYGFFFDALFEVCPEAVVRTNRMITKDSGNWIDWDIGAPIAPAPYSSACECHDHGIYHEPAGYTSVRGGVV
jgi:hypothetical protein